MKIEGSILNLIGTRIFDAPYTGEDANLDELKHEIIDLIKRSWKFYNDFLDSENTNELSSYDQLIPTLKTQQSQAKEQEVASSSTLPASAYVETVEEPEATVAIESLTPTQNSIATASKTSPVNKTLSGSGSKKKDDAPKTENQISGLNALIPLLALGGLGYYLARR